VGAAPIDGAATTPTARDFFANCLGGSGATECFSATRAASESNLFADCLRRIDSTACFSAPRLAALAVSPADTLLSPPGNLAAQVAGTSVTLTWSQPGAGSPVSSYTVEAGSSPGLANLARLVTGAATSFFVAGVPAGTYYVRVRATNAAGTSDPSNEIAVVVASGCVVPSPPTLVLLSNSGGAVSLSWTLPAGAPTSYVLQAGSAPGLANLANVNLGNASRTFNTNGVPSGTYYVRVYARNACGLSAPSGELTIFVGIAQPQSFIRFLPESFGIGSFCECIGGSRTVITARTDGEVRGTRNCDNIDSLIVPVSPGTHTAAACYTLFGQDNCWDDTLSIAPGQTGFLHLTVSFCDRRER